MRYGYIYLADVAIMKLGRVLPFSILVYISDIIRRAVAFTFYPIPNGINVVNRGAFPKIYTLSRRLDSLAYLRQSYIFPQTVISLG